MGEIYSVCNRLATGWGHRMGESFSVRDRLATAQVVTFRFRGMAQVEGGYGKKCR